MYDRIKLRSKDNHAINFATILDRTYSGTGVKSIEQVFPNGSVRAYFLKDKVLQIASYVPLTKNATTQYPINLVLDSYPVSDIIKIGEVYNEHSLVLGSYSSLNVSITLPDEEVIYIDEANGLHVEEYKNDFRNDLKVFLKSLKESM